MGATGARKDGKLKRSACAGREEKTGRRGVSPRAWELASRHPAGGNHSAPHLNWSRPHFGSKGAPGTVAGEEGQGGFTIPLACERLGLLHPTSSRMGVAHSHANPFSVGRLGPTAQCVCVWGGGIAWGQGKTKGGCAQQPRLPGSRYVTVWTGRRQ